MNKDVIVALARAAGLDKALENFPEDVMAAAAQAIGNVSGFTAPTSPAAEPWPPMRAGSGTGPAL